MLSALEDGAGGIGREIGLAPAMLELITGSRFPEPAPSIDDPKVVRLRPV